MGTEGYRPSLAVELVERAPLGFTIPSKAAAEAPTKKTHAGDARIKDMSVERLDTLLADKSKTAVTVFDANSESTREKYGVIPGATLLSGYKDYNLTATLPADKKAEIVFYCGSEMCRAAPKAATRAADAGYQNVSCLPVGIKGWVQAGKAVDKSDTKG